ncbi:dolichyl-phosphate-mannose--protein mannosyltransferase [Pseudozyma hubeiensis SY62]|uniref:Dolichyl-phosphate-mannose--protein mannosyltransferase n=1 Tax=Pseudozyma hubeiensis (strain SY62) TaxID=1305764 RepID=R9P4T5_PSEHS|nr:dolichyl-phosphate-mannose--protein mannosyltransferase [Pseudozyma hubeiensis SY62]GAC96314.1 dolichyl-phosphate-mannose--protein mannosyltransferase [Pseudozyma hubeiensis SY62]
MSLSFRGFAMEGPVTRHTRVNDEHPAVPSRLNPSKSGSRFVPPHSAKASLQRECSQSFDTVKAFCLPLPFIFLCCTASSSPHCELHRCRFHFARLPTHLELLRSSRTVPCVPS